MSRVVNMLLGTPSSEDGNAREDVDWEMNFKPSIRISEMVACVYRLNFSMTYKSGVEFQMELKIIYRRGFRSQTTQNLVISRCCFAKDG